jgi:multiple sugar transport system substrate-binding protein/putative aldouronate transport system substrate-binding protein
MIPGGSLPGWATKYYEVFPSDCTLYRSFATEKYNGGPSIVIFKDSENIETCLKLVDMMADPYEWMEVYYGPEGCMWNEENGVLSITDEFAAWLKKKGSINFSPMPDGTEYSIFNTTTLIGTGTPLADHVDINGDPLPYIPTSWPDAQAITTNNDNWNAWKETMGAKDLWDYTEQHGIEVIQKSPFDGWVLDAPDDTQLLTIASLKDVVVPACWKMVYAKYEAEFEAIWDAMVKDAETMGAKDIYDWYTKAYHAPN